MLKKLFGGARREEAREYTIDELIVLERYQEAGEKLRERIKLRDELHDHLKLADVYLQLAQTASAVDEYVYVADEYADDGFFDRALAVLSKARKVSLEADAITQRVERYERAKVHERKRTAALEGFLKGSSAKKRTVVEFQTLWLPLVESPLVRQLSGDQLGLLFAAVEVVQVAPEHKLAEPGKSAEELFIVVRGEVTVTASMPDGQPNVLRTLGAGQVLGEGALLSRRPWAASYAAKGRTTLLRLDRGGLEQCLTGNPDPRGFLAALRQEENDAQVARLAEALARPS